MIMSAKLHYVAFQAINKIRIQYNGFILLSTSKLVCSEKFSHMKQARQKSTYWMGNNSVFDFAFILFSSRLLFNYTFCV